MAKDDYDDDDDDYGGGGGDDDDDGGGGGRDDDDDGGGGGDVLTGGRLLHVSSHQRWKSLACLLVHELFVVLTGIGVIKMVINIIISTCCSLFL